MEAAGGGSGAENGVDEWEEANRSRRREQAASASGQQDAIAAAEALALLLEAAISAPERRAAAEAGLAAAADHHRRGAAGRFGGRRLLANARASVRALWRDLLRRWRRQRQQPSSSGGGSSASGRRHGDDRYQRVALLALAATPLDWADPLHRRVMAALHAACAALAAGQPQHAAASGASAGPGPHWKPIGFQGDDPATDLRAAGMLGAAQLLAFAQARAPAAAAAWRILGSASCGGVSGNSSSNGSSSNASGLPFALVSLNISAWAVTALRRGALDRLPLADAAGAFYVGAWRELCKLLLLRRRRWARPAASPPLLLARLKRRAERSPGAFLPDSDSGWDAVLKMEAANLKRKGWRILITRWRGQPL